jgi:hypothetical protein
VEPATDPVELGLGLARALEMARGSELAWAALELGQAARVLDPVVLAELERSPSERAGLQTPGR